MRIPIVTEHDRRMMEVARALAWRELLRSGVQTKEVTDAIALLTTIIEAGGLVQETD